jgi:hypothetical protein
MPDYPNIRKNKTEGKPVQFTVFKKVYFSKLVMEQI